MQEWYQSSHQTPKETIHLSITVSLELGNSSEQTVFTDEDHAIQLKALNRHQNITNSTSTLEVVSNIREVNA